MMILMVYNLEIQSDSFIVSVLKFVNYTGPCKVNFRAFKLSGS